LLSVNQKICWYRATLVEAYLAGKMKSGLKEQAASGWHQIFLPIFRASKLLTWSTTLANLRVIFLWKKKLKRKIWRKLKIYGKKNSMWFLSWDRLPIQWYWRIDFWILIFGFRILRVKTNFNWETGKENGKKELFFNSFCFSGFFVRKFGFLDFLFFFDFIGIFDDSWFFVCFFWGMVGMGGKKKKTKEKGKLKVKMKNEKKNEEFEMKNFFVKKKEKWRWKEKWFWFFVFLEGFLGFSFYWEWRTEINQEKEVEIWFICSKFVVPGKAQFTSTICSNFYTKFVFLFLVFNSFPFCDFFLNECEEKNADHYF